MSKREFVMKALMLTPVAALGSKLIAADDKIMAILASQIETLKKLAGINGSPGLYKAGQAPGQTTGATIATGFIGEKQETVLASFFTKGAATDGVYYDVTDASITLTAGVWRIDAHGILNLNGSAMNAGALYTLKIAIRDTSGNIIAQSGAIFTTFNSSSCYPFALPSSFTATVNISSTVLYKLSIFQTYAGGAADAGGKVIEIRGDIIPTYIKAVRIA